MRMTIDVARTDGSKRLAKWLKDNETSQTDLAKRLGIEQPSISRWVSGGSRPDPALRDAIALITGIEAEAWRSAKEKKLLARVSGEPLATGTEGR